MQRKVLAAFLSLLGVILLAALAHSLIKAHLAPAIGAEALGGTKDWIVVRADNGLFEILMPGEPEVHKLGSGSIRMTYLDAIDGEFALSVSDAPPSVAVAHDVELLLDATQQGIVQGFESLGAPMEVQRGKLASMPFPAREVRVRRPPGAADDLPDVLVHIYYVQGRYLYMLSHGNTGHRSESISRRFLDSFCALGHQPLGTCKRSGPTGASP